MHATSVCLHEKAFVIIGPSGIGKSSLALSLIHKGALLIADDNTRIQGNWAYGPKNHIGWLEVRCIGLISGFTVCQKAEIGAIIELTSEELERLPQKTDKIPTFRLNANDPFLVDKVLLISDLISGKLNHERIE